MVIDSCIDVVSPLAERLQSINVPYAQMEIPLPSLPESYVSSTQITHGDAFIGLNSEARSRGIFIQLLDVCPSVRDVFKLTRLERMFEFGTVASNE